jgi:SNF2 family DNA or RNA helicase
MKEISIPGHEFKTVPWFHQIRGVKLLINVNCLALLWDMRTGKTFTVVNAIEFLKNHGQPYKTLVICPIHVKVNWVEDCQKHTNLKALIMGQGTKKQLVALRTADRYTVVDGPKIRKTYGEPDIFITNADAIRAVEFRDALRDAGFGIIVVDESHMFKNPGSKRTQALFRIKRTVARRYCLTGTMISRCPQDAWAQMKFLNEFVITESYDEFGDRYCIFRRDGQQKYFVRPRKRRSKELWHRVNAISDKVRIEDCHDMPKKAYDDILVEMSSEEKKHHYEVVKFLLTEIEGKKVNTTTLLKSRKLIQVTSGFAYTKDGEIVRLKKPSKIPVLKDCLEQVYRDDRKVVIWAYHHETMGMIKELLEEEDIGHSFVSGKSGRMTMARRHEEMWKFKNDSGIWVMLANPAMMGIGVDLTEASHCIYYENDFRLDYRVQSEARIYGDKSKERHGDRICIWDLIMRGSIDVHLRECLKGKKNYLDFMNAKKLRSLVE